MSRYTSERRLFHHNGLASNNLQCTFKQEMKHLWWRAVVHVHSLEPLEGLELWCNFQRFRNFWNLLSGDLLQATPLKQGPLVLWRCRACISWGIVHCLESLLKVVYRPVQLVERHVRVYAYMWNCPSTSCARLYVQATFWGLPKHFTGLPKTHAHMHVWICPEVLLNVLKGHA